MSRNIRKKKVEGTICFNFKNIYKIYHFGIEIVFVLLDFRSTNLIIIFEAIISILMMRHSRSTEFICSCFFVRILTLNIIANNVFIKSFDLFLVSGKRTETSSTIDHFFSPIRKENDVYQAALKKQLDSANIKPSDDQLANDELVNDELAKVELVNNELANELSKVKLSTEIANTQIVKLEQKLEDAERANAKLLEDYQKLQRNHVRVLTALVRLHSVHNQKKPVPKPMRENEANSHGNETHE